MLRQTQRLPSAGLEKSLDHGFEYHT